MGHILPPVRLPPDTPPGYRVFGRNRAFDVECPHCGHVVLIGQGRGKSARAQATGRGSAYWDPLASRLRCPGCDRRWVIGLAIWPAKEGNCPGLPADQVPSPAQLAQLRQETGAWVQETSKAGRAACVNLAAPVCSCPLWDGSAGRMAGTRKALDPGCGRHGKGGAEPDPGQD